MNREEGDACRQAGGTEYMCVLDVFVYIGVNVITRYGRKSGVSPT